MEARSETLSLLKVLFYLQAIYEWISAIVSLLPLPNYVTITPSLDTNLTSNAPSTLTTNPRK